MVTMASVITSSQGMRSHTELTSGLGWLMTCIHIVSYDRKPIFHPYSGEVIES
jgi:hypothetical protein